jgi:membrane associated rhomboid family serine protease
MNMYRSSFLSNIPPIVKNLIAINIVMWLATLVFPSFINRFGMNADLTDILGMHYWASEKFNPAQLMTYMFMHGGWGHLFFNMFALYMFGGVLEQYWGPKRFLIYYMITGVGAGFVQQLFWTVEYHSLVSAMNHAISTGSLVELEAHQSMLERFFRFGNFSAMHTSDIINLKRLFLNLPVTVGASGSVFGLLLAFGWLFPDVKLMMLFFPVPIKARVFVVLYGVAELFLGVANFSGDSVAHFAHLGGMLFGIVMILIWKKTQFKKW